MSPTLIALQSLAALFFGFLLVAPLLSHFVFLEDGDHFPRTILGGLLTDETCGWPFFPSLIADYAFYSGLLLSFNSTGGGDEGIKLGQDVSSVVNAVRQIVGMAFDQGQRLRFVWPPQPASSPFGNPGSDAKAGAVAVPDAAYDNIPVVRPMATVLFGIPVLAMLFVLCVTPPLRALAGIVYLDAVQPLATRVLDMFASVLTSTAESLRSLLPRAYQLLRNGAQLSYTYVVHTFLPFVFGAAMVLTTAIGIVLYGIGYVGMAALVNAGLFGPHTGALEAAWRSVTTHWRALQQIDWSWWWRMLVVWDRWHRQDYADNGDDSGDHDQDDDGDSGSVNSSHGHRHHHHHHHHHHHSDDCNNWFWRFLRLFARRRHEEAQLGPGLNLLEDIQALGEEEKRQALRQLIRNRGIVSQGVDGTDASAQEQCGSPAWQDAIAQAIVTEDANPQDGLPDPASSFSSVLFHSLEHRETFQHAQHWQVTDEEEAEAREKAHRRQPFLSGGDDGCM